MFYLYKITNMLSSKVYIGQSDKETERWRQHKYFAKYPEKTRQYIHRAMNKYGIDNFIYEVIATCRTDGDADETEKLLIQQYDSQNQDYGYNIAPGGSAAWNRGLPPEQQPMYGKTQSDYQKQRMSEVHTGKIAPHSREWKDNMSKIMKGRKNTWFSKMVETRKANGSFIISEEEKNRLRTLMVGRTLSDETKSKISSSMKGKESKIKGEKCARAKLTWDIVKQIREEFAQGNISKNKLAKKYGVSQPAIKDIILNRTWKI